MYNDEEMDRQLENIINEIFTSSEFANIIELILDDMQEFREETVDVDETAYVAPTFDSFPYQATEEEEKVECSICLIDFENNDDVTLLKCCHCFHKTCIEEWSKIKAECPNCREKILS